MKTKTIIKEALPLLFISWAIIFGVAVFMAPCVPDQLPSHWNAQGQVDGYSSKPMAVFLFLGMIIAFYILLVFLPRFDPFKKNYQQFAKAYSWLRIIMVSFFVAFYIIFLLAASGHLQNIQKAIIPLMALLFVAMGFLMPKIKRNYFVGIKTPWTLHSDEVWAKTHKLGGWCFGAAGVLTFFTAWLGEWGFLIFMAIISVAGLLPVVYSYLEYKKLGLFKN
ncbi:MAG: SdpI family protein [Candidatus Gribaldobacteria bacterium]|nr:SdpI family protein [Candidatus Gribaldobacteria bacterium]